MPKIPGVSHTRAVRALEKAGFRVVREGKHIERTANEFSPYLARTQSMRTQWVVSSKESHQALSFRGKLIHSLVYPRSGGYAGGACMSIKEMKLTKLGRIEASQLISSV